MFRASIWYVSFSLTPCVPFLSYGPMLRIPPGSEVDLDLGNYERYLAVTLGGDNNITTGKIYQHVCILERLHFHIIF